MDVMIKKLLIILIIFLVPAIGLADTWYVTQAGDGNTDGTDIDNAWSVAQFNNSAQWAGSGNIDPGDTVYFSGTITTRLLPQGSGYLGHTITLDGYAAGDCDPINSVCSSSAILSGANAGLRIATGQDYLTIQDFRATGGGTGYAIMSIYNSTTSDSADYITFKRNYIYDANLNLFLCTNLYGGEATYDSAKYLTLTDNKMVGYGKTANAAQGLNFVRVDDLILRNNELGGDGGANVTNSSNVIEFHYITNFLVELNSIHDANEQAGLAIKEIGSQVNTEGIVRYNKFYNNGTTEDNGRGISLTMNAGYANHDIYIYANYIYGGSDFGIDIHRGNYNIHAWSNIIADNDRNGIILWTQSGGYLAEHDIFLYNNTIYANETDDTGSSEEDRTGIGIRETAADDIFIKNNILMDNRPNATSYQQWTSHSTIGAGESDYNTIYYTGQTASYYYDGGIRTLAVMGSSYNLESNSEIADPGMNDPSNGDFTLSGTTTAGEDLSGTIATVTVQGIDYVMDYKWGLDPAGTNWATDPPTVAVVSRDDHQWDRGAYVYTASTSPSIITVSVDDNAAFESGTTNGVWTLHCSPTCSSVSVTYALSGTATGGTSCTAGVDYTLTSLTTIVVDGTSQVITITACDDAVVEDYEEIATLTVTEEAAYNVGTPASGNIGVYSDDAGMPIYDYGVNKVR